MIRLGLIACGDVAFRTYIPGIEALGNRATLMAVFDPLLERAERAAARFPGCAAYQDLNSFLAHPGLQGVFNLTPANLHTAVNTAVLDAGLHLFSEKPVASTVEEGQALAAKAANAGLTFLCAPAVMATGRFQWIRRLIDGGAFGTLTVASGQMANLGPAAWKEYTGDPGVFYSAGVGPVMDTGVYVLHGMTGLLGPAKRVQAFAGITIPQRTVTIPRLAGQTITVESPDVNIIGLDFGDNGFGQVLSTFAVPGTNGPAMEVHGSLASLSINAGEWYAANSAIDLFFVESGVHGAAGWHRNSPNPTPLGPPEEHLIWSGPRHFVDCLADGAAPLLTAEHAIHVLEIILGARKSAISGCATELNTTF